ncbi:hypothetical protein APSETT445_005983 [Aspergillus pseudonomiae]
MSAPPFQIPGQPFFTELFQCWRETPKKTLIRDLSGCCPEATLERFLYDVVTLRTRLWDSLDEHAKQALRDPNADNVFIAVLATPGYEYAVLCYTIYSVGAVIVPLYRKAPGVLVEEAKYFLELCDAVLLTTGTAGVQHAQAISAQVGVQSFTFNPTQSPPPDNPAFVLESHDRCDSINMEKGFVLLYTSGTTGPPKGVLHSRRSAVAGLRSLMGHMGMSPHDTWLLHSPVHWMGGFWQFFITLLAGACVEFCASVCNPDWLMERLSAGDVSCMVMTPTMLDKMEKKLDTAQKSWSSSRYESVLAGIRALRVLATGSMPVGPVRRTVWKDLRGGKPLVDLYGMTEELAMIARTSWESDEVIRFNGWKVFAPEVEEALSTHPYVSQVIILGVSDLHTGQRVAALLIPRWDNTSGNKLDLATIRGWLSQEKGILQYKLPTLLRVLRPTQKYPVTSSGKPIKPQIREELFNNTELVNGTVEVWDLAAKEPGMAARPFDWAGI